MAAHAQAAPATGATATIHGHIADQTGALIPGATVTIATADGIGVARRMRMRVALTPSPGCRQAAISSKRNIPALHRSNRRPIPVLAGQVKRVDIAMAIEVEQQSVVVTDDSPSVNVEASGNANAIVLKDKDLDALSDDPDELSNELSALAGPSAGPNGGQIYIDGFSGGQLPPKSAIREIRINQNPFSAEFDRLGYGRIEILTKPGS